MINLAYLDLIGHPNHFLVTDLFLPVVMDYLVEVVEAQR